MTLPASDLFDVADWNPRARVAQDGSASITDTGVGLLPNVDKRGSVDVMSGNFAVGAAASTITAVSSAKIRGVTVGEVLTVEISLRFASSGADRLIPTANPSDAFFRLRLAPAAYPELLIYFTDSGVFVAGHGNSGKTLITGSAAYAADDCVLRLVVDQATRTVSLYAGEPDAYKPGNGPWYNYPNITKLGTVRIPAVWALADDEGIFIEAAGSVQDVLALITSLRVASTKVLVTAKPVAEITAKEVCVAGSILSLYSSAPESQELEHVWDIEKKPDGANPLLTGRAYAGFVLDSASGGVRIRAVEATSALNGWRVIAQRGRANAELSLAVNTVQKRLTIKYAVDSAGDITTTPKLLGYAFGDPANAAYVQGIADLFTVEILATNIDEPLSVGNGLLTGGAGSSAKNTSALLDKPGVYVLSLRTVQNGVWSDPALHTVFVQLSDQLIGGVPDSSLFLTYINDFWKTVDDLGQVQAVWTAATRLFGAAVSELWQQDMAKSLPEMPERFSRKWLTFHNEETVGVQLTFVDTHEVIVTAPAAAVGFRDSRLLDVPDNNFADDDVVLLCSTAGVPVIRVVRRLDTDLLGLSEGGAPVVRAYGDFNVQYVSDTELFVPAEIDVAVPGDLYVELRNTETAVVLPVAGYDATSRILTLTSTGIAPRADGYLTMTLLAHAGRVRVLRCPYFASDATASVGDIAIIRVDDIVNGIDVECAATVLAANDGRLIVDLQELQRAYSAAASVAGESISLDLAVASVSLLAVRSATTLGYSAELVSVPYLGTAVKHDVLIENSDYVVSAGAIVANDSTAGVFSASGGVLTPVASRLTAVGDLFADVLITTGLHPGLYVGERQRDGAIRINGYRDGGYVYGRVPRFTAARLPAAEYVAEICYYSNDESLWRNFGVLVGHSRDQHADLGLTSPYSGVVRGMWSAFMHGPNLESLRTAAQIIVGLPYTTRAGHIIEITESDDPAQDGYILLLVGQELLTFRLPFGMSLARNPNTGRVIRASDPAGDKTDVWYDSEVPAFFSFVDVISVADTLTNADVVEHAFSALDVLRSRHTFIVRVPLNTVALGDIVVLLRSFLREAKPAYTNFIVLGVLGASDSVTISDSTTRTVTVFKKDTMYYPAFRGPAELDDEERALVVTADEAAYPLLSTVERHPADSWTAADAVNRYDAGYATGMLNNYAGDGSWNALHTEVDPPNRIVSEIDVPASRMWVPVLLDTEAPDLQIGEFVTVSSHPDSRLNLSRPYVEHIGCGEHPKIPFGVRSPQKQHSLTYVLLAFDAADPETGRCDGNEGRLTALADLDDAVVLEGATSGAQAFVTLAPSMVDNPEYFLLEHVLHFDVATDMCPRDTVRVVLTTYIPLAGVTYEDLRAVGSFFDDAEAAQVLRLTTPYEVDTEAGNYPAPYRALMTRFADKADDDFVVFDFANAEGELPFGEYESASDQTALANIHVGYSRSSRVLRSPPHGFTGSSILTPAVLTVEFDGVTVRLDGAGFLDADPSAPVGPPSQTEYAGEVGMTWVYFEHGSASYAADQVVFEIGTASGRTVHGHDGADFSSTGNILVAYIPAGIPADVYNIRVSNIRPYNDGVARTAVTSYVMESALDLTAFVNPFVNDDGAGLSTAGFAIAGG